MALNKTNNSLGGEYIPESTYFGTNAPTSTTSYNAGDEWFVTSNGTKTGTILNAWRFDGIQWNKFPGGSTKTVTAQLDPVITFLTTAQLTALLNPEIGDTYIVTDGTNKGDIAKWNGTQWIYYVPKDKDQTTVTSSGGR